MTSEQSNRKSAPIKIKLNFKDNNFVSFLSGRVVYSVTHKYALQRRVLQQLLIDCVNQKKHVVIEQARDPGIFVTLDGAKYQIVSISHSLLLYPNASRDQAPRFAILDQVKNLSAKSVTRRSDKTLLLRDDQVILKLLSHDQRRKHKIYELPDGSEKGLQAFAAMIAEEAIVQQAILGKTAKAALRTSDGYSNITSFYADGETLEAMFSKPSSLKKYQNNTTPVERLFIMWATMERLRAIHLKNHVHGDIKPGNVVFDQKTFFQLTDISGDAETVRARALAKGKVISNEEVASKAALASGLVIIDFDCSYRVGECLSVGGTLGYMAPNVNQIITEKPFANDIFAAGVTLYELYTGKALIADPGYFAAFEIFSTEKNEAGKYKIASDYAVELREKILQNLSSDKSKIAFLIRRMLCVTESNNNVDMEEVVGVLEHSLKFYEVLYKFLKEQFSDALDLKRKEISSNGWRSFFNSYPPYINKLLTFLRKLPDKAPQELQTIGQRIAFYDQVHRCYQGCQRVLRECSVQQFSKISQEVAQATPMQAAVGAEVMAASPQQTVSSLVREDGQVKAIKPDIGSPAAWLRFFVTCENAHWSELNLSFAAYYQAQAVAEPTVAKAGL